MRCGGGICDGRLINLVTGETTEYCGNKVSSSALITTSLPTLSMDIGRFGIGGLTDTSGIQFVIQGCVELNDHAVEHNKEYMSKLFAWELSRNTIGALEQ